MEARQFVRLVPLPWPSDEPETTSVPLESGDDLGPLRQAILRTRRWLLDAQHAEGHWVAELEGDTILESEYVLLLAYLGRHDTERAGKAAAYLLERQLPEGGWSQYPGGRIDISASVKAYFALKLTGCDPSDEPMQRARAAILAHGGADAVNSFTRFYLALLGQISYDDCPAVPPEFALLPKWFPINLYAVSAWTRTIVVPLSIISALRPTTEVDPRHGIRELFLREPADWPPLRSPGLEGPVRTVSWERFFRLVDSIWRLCQRRGWLPLRRRAIEVSRRWMIDRFAESDGLGAIFPPMVWSIIALRALGYDDESLEQRYCHERLEGLVIEEPETVRLQPCKSPVWDTAIAMRAVADSGLPADHPALESGFRWLLDREVTRRGDWAETVDAEPAGWYFEHANEFYPDLDDTAMVVMALHLQHGARSETAAAPNVELMADPDTAERPPRDTQADAEQLARTARGIARAERWMLAMQNRDGGWGAFDKDNNRQFLCKVPFADHNAMIDPSTPDLTGRVLESLATLGHRTGEKAVDRAVAYLRQTQEADGSWFGRWGVNYVYGTWQTLVGLAAVGVPHDDPAVAAGACWLIAHQQPCGGWGESPDSYEDPTLRGQGTPTASQTAWAVLGLMAAGLHDHPATRRGMEFLVDRQLADGSWYEPEFTGTGFPRVFYLRYHMYPIYFPLMALSRWAVFAQTARRPRQPAALTFVDPALDA